MFRKRGRKPIQCFMQLNHDRIGHFGVVTRDISSSGIFIDVEPPMVDDVLSVLNVGDKIEAEVDNPDNQYDILHFTVMRLAPDGFGLSFAS